MGALLSRGVLLDSEKCDQTRIGSVIAFKDPLTDDFGPLTDNKFAKTVMIFVVEFLGFLGIIGMIVEATPLGNSRNYNNIKTLLA